MEFPLDAPCLQILSPRVLPLHSGRPNLAISRAITPIHFSLISFDPPFDHLIHSFSLSFSPPTDTIVRLITLFFLFFSLSLSSHRGYCADRDAVRSAVNGV